MIEWYELYGDTSPGFIPACCNWLDSPSDPNFIESMPGENHYYLNHAVSVYFQASSKSNMGYVFHKMLNENAGATSDRNWVSIPYNAIYGTIGDITAEYSPSGDPIVKITKLRDDQYYSS